MCQSDRLDSSSSQHLPYEAYIHGLITVLSVDNYTRDIMNIIDHMYICIPPPPPPINKEIINNLTRFVLYQLIRHRDRCPVSLSTIVPSIMTMYHDKAKHEPLLQQVLSVFDPSADNKLSTLKHGTTLLLPYFKARKILANSLHSSMAQRYCCPILTLGNHSTYYQRFHLPLY